MPIFPCSARVACLFAASALVLTFYGASGCGGSHPAPTVVSAQTTTPSNGETIVMIRHGEDPANGLGQLTCMGENRAMALPNVLISRFGNAAAIFAPDPGDQITEGGSTYSYVRPLATIEPTAVQLGLPVNTQIGYTDVATLQTDVTASAYANSTVFIAWEHTHAYMFAQQLLTAYGQDPSTVPTWPSDDYEMMYVFHITPPAAGSTGKGTLSFQVQQEGLESSLTDTCPGQ